MTTIQGQVLRGGSWFNNGGVHPVHRATHPNQTQPTARGPALGFRTFLPARLPRPRCQPPATFDDILTRWWKRLSG